jgi:hypothetical protein
MHLASHLIPTHPIPSHLISSYLIPSHPIPSHPIPSHPTRYDVKFCSPDGSVELARGKQQDIFRRRVQPTLQKQMLAHGRVIHYDGKGLLHTIGEIDLARAAQLGADGWCAAADDEATWQERGRLPQEDGAPKVKLEVVIKKCAGEPLALGDLSTPRQQELQMMLMGAVESTFASKYRMIGPRLAIKLGRCC